MDFIRRPPTKRQVNEWSRLPNYSNAFCRPEFVINLNNSFKSIFLLFPDHISLQSILESCFLQDGINF